MTQRKLPTLLMLSLIVAGFAACSTWERTIYNSLAASKAVIDQAGRDYNAGAIAQTAANRALIEKARAAQTVATEAFEEYALLRVSRQTAGLSQQRQLVIQAVAQIAPLIEAIHELYSKGGGGAGQ